MNLNLIMRRYKTDSLIPKEEVFYNEISGSLVNDSHG